MDAISFVMGLRAAYLRSSNMKQLIYNADGRSEATRRTAYVEVCCVLYSYVKQQLSNIKYNSSYLKQKRRKKYTLREQ
jgi:chromosome segregation ATPase